MEAYKEIFKKIYENHNEEVYLKDVVVFLRKAYENIDDNHDVKILLDQYDISGDRELTFNEFALEAAEESEDIDEVDMKELFIEADIARRNSVELLVTPAPKVYNKFNRHTVAKVTGIASFAKSLKKPAQ